MKTKKIAKNYLDIVFVPAPDLAWRKSESEPLETEEKFVTLDVENKGFFNFIAQKFFGQPKVRTRSMLCLQCGKLSRPQESTLGWGRQCAGCAWPSATVPVSAESDLGPRAWCQGTKRHRGGRREPGQAPPPGRGSLQSP